MASTPDHTTETSATPEAEGGIYRWYVLAMLTLVSLFSVADRLVFGILIEDIKAEFSLNDFQIGLLGGLAFAITYVIAGFPAARLADRSIRKNIIAAAIAFWSLMTALCGAATSFWLLFFARTGVGVGEGCSGPASQSLVADYFRREELAKAMGFLTIGASMGTVTGLMAGGLLSEAFGWRWAFVLMGLPGILLGLILYLTVREPERGRFAPKGATIEQQPVRETASALVRNRVFMGLAIGWALQIMIGYALAVWMAPIMMRDFGLGPGDVGVYLGLAFLIGGIPGPILGGLLTGYLAKSNEAWRAWMPGLVSFGCLIPLAISLTSGAFWPFLIWFALAYGIFVMSQAGILSGIQSSVEPSQRGFAVAIALFFNNLIGQALGIPLIGWVSDGLTSTYGTSALSIAVFGVCVVSGVLALAVFAWTGMQMRTEEYAAKINAT